MTILKQPLYKVTTKSSTTESFDIQGTIIIHWMTDKFFVMIK